MAAGAAAAAYEMEDEEDGGDDGHDALQYLSQERDLFDEADETEQDRKLPPQEQQGQQQGQQQQEQQEPATAATSHFYTFLADKAGMQGVSKEEVARIVHEASVNSRYYKHQQRQDAKLQQRIEAIQRKCATLTEGQRRRLEEQADRELAEAERLHRSHDRVCCVVDLDAFFAAVEERDRPELKTKPFAVGGGVICTANYEARKYGVRSAMPAFIAKKLCPTLLILPTRFEAYQAVAEQTRTIFREYDPQFRAGSLDEAYLDLTQVVKARAAAAGVRVPPGGEKGGEGEGEAEEGEDEEEDEAEAAQAGGGGEGPYVAYWELAEAVVHEMRGRILETCRITASAGIATSFMLAKVASNERKPNGQFLVRDVPGYLHPLPVRSVGGIGRKTERVLTAGLGIHVVRDLFEKRGLLYHAFTPLTAQWLATRYLGVDVGNGEEEGGEGGGGDGGYGRKGISRERTFAVISQTPQLLQKLRELCDGLAKDMAEEGGEGGLQARSVTLKLKDASFNLTTRAKTLSHYVSSADELFEAAHALLLPQLPIALRLMGVRASAFRPRPGKDQGTLDGFLAKAKDNGAGGGGGGAASGPSSFLSLPPPPSPSGPSGKRKEGGGGGGGGGTIEAFLVKRAASSTSTSTSNKSSSSSGAAAAVVVIDDDDDEEVEGEQEVGGGQQPQPPSNSSSSSANTYTCPICGSLRAGESLAAFNQHVDGCLARTDPRFQQQPSREGSKGGGGGGSSKRKRAGGPLDAFLSKQK